MGMFDGKKGLIVGVANDRSIAWAIAERIMAEGGECGFTHLPDRPDDEKRRNHRRVDRCINGSENAKFLVPLDVRDDQQIAEVMARAKDEFGTIDFLLHSVAYATLDDLKVDTIESSRAGFLLAMEISAYSLLAICNAAKDIMANPSAIATMTYLGGEQCVPGYNVMGVCKAALDSAMKYAAHDLGPRGIRVNAISAGPLKTLASSAVGAKGLEQLYEHMAPLGRNITHEDVAGAGAYMLSEMSGGVSGEILHVDAGYNIMGSPGRLLNKFGNA